MLKVYISSPISDYQAKWNIQVTKLLRFEGFLVYLPQEIDLISKNHKKFPITIFEKCCEMIVSSDFGLLLLPYGRDCAWEVGYYKGLNKPIYVYAEELDKEQKMMLRDWMIKGSIDKIITTSKKTSQIFLHDPILQSKKINYIKNIHDLPNTLYAIYESYKSILSSAYLGVGAVVIKKDKVLLVREKTNSRFYMRKKGMWGYPTKLFTSQNTPTKQSLISLTKETHLIGDYPRFISQEAIPNAIGLFYKVSLKGTQKLKNGQWFPIEDVIKEKVYLRPTYVNVLKKLLKN